MNKVIISILLILLSFSANAQYYLDQALMALSEDDYEKAFDYLNQELDENPENAQAWLIRGAILFDHNRISDALNDVNKAIKFVSTTDSAVQSGAYSLRGLIYQRVEENDKAFIDYEKAIGIAPSNADIYVRRAELYYTIKDYEKSEADYRSIIKLDDSDTRGYVGIGRGYLSQEKYTEAVAILTQALNRSSNHTAALYYRAKANYELNRYDEAITDIFTCLDLARDANDARESFLEFSVKDLPLAMAKINSRIANDENKLFWYYVRANLNKKAKKQEDAIEDYTVAIKKATSEEKYIILIERGELYIEMGLPRKALTDFSDAISISPQAYAYGDKGNAYMQMGKFKEAEENYSIAIEKDPELIMVYLIRGYIYDLTNKRDQALKDYDYAVSLDKNFLYARLLRGNLLLKAFNDTARANPDFRFVLLNDTVVQERTNGRQFALYLTGHSDEALAWNSKILEKYPNDFNYYQSCCLLAQMDKKQDALKALQLAFENGFVDFAIVKLHRDLDNIKNMTEFKSLVKASEEKHAEKMKNVN